MRKWNLAVVAFAVASSAAAAEPVAPSCADVASKPVAAGPTLAQDFARRAPLLQRQHRLAPDLRNALRGIPLVEPGIRRADTVPDGLLGARTDAAPAAPVTPPMALAATPASAGGSPQAIGDVHVYQSADFFGGAIRRLSNPNGANDYYGLRFTTSQAAKQLPFQVDAVWMFMDDAIAWSKNWQVSVVTESLATPFLPDRSAIVSGPVTFDASAPPYSFTKAAQPTRTVNVKIELPNQDYPLASKFAINDGSMNDDFNRANEDLNQPTGNWVECSPTGCFTGLSLKINNNRLGTSGPGTVLGWRGADPNAGDCDPSTTATAPCTRYIIDYIDNAQLQIYHPDMDARYSLQFDLSGPAATSLTAGIFTRAQLDYSVNPPAPATYYAAWVDRVGGRLVITDQTFTNVLASTPLAATTGTLEVEVSGYNPVVIRASVGATTVTANDSTLLFQGDISFGNIGGVVFPNAGGTEVVDDFRTNRNADLFVVLKMPAGEAVALWADARPESRDFFNTFITSDGTAWGQTGIASDVDCAKSRNTIASLQTRDGSGGNSMFQSNDTVMSLFIPCCGCPRKPYTCGPYPYMDECDPSPGNWTQDTQPDYTIGQAIDIDPKFLNDHAPDTVGRVLFYWLVCNDLDAGCGFGTCDPTPVSGNCGGYAFGLGPLLASNQIPGLNTTTSQDIPNWDGDTFLDGPLFLQAATPATYTPPAAGNYHVYMIELFDYTNPPDGPDDPNPDDYLANRYVSRPFTVGGCLAPKPYNFNPNSLIMAKTGGSCATTDIYAEWRQQTLPFDPTIPFNIHEVGTHAALVTNLTPCVATGCNPWPTTPTFTGIVNSTFCVTPAAVSNDVNYYEVYQQDDCTTDSRADQ